MSAVDLHQSLQALRATADRLEAPPRGEAPAAIDLRAAPGPAPAPRSMGRLLVATAVHTAITVAVLAGVTALVDPVLPHAERPALSGPAEPSPTPAGDLLASPNTP